MCADKLSIRNSTKENMAKYDMCEAMYALPDGKIIPHKKPITIPLLIFIAGAALLAVNGWLLAEVDMPDLKSALVLFGSVFIMVGGAITSARLAGNSTNPYFKNDGCFLQREELKFRKEQKPTVMELFDNGNFTNVRQIPSDGVSSVVVEVYSSPKSGFTAAQVFEYADLELQPISELKIIE